MPPQPSFFELSIPFVEDHLGQAVELVRGRDVADGAVQADMVIVLDIPTHELTGFLQRSGRRGPDTLVLHRPMPALQLPVALGIVRTGPHMGHSQQPNELLEIAGDRGASVNGATLFSTTFPCHECARHIVAAGVKRVVYVEPYPKSFVNELYPDSIEIDVDDYRGTHVVFEPFVGVSPRRYLDLFSLGDLDRKDKMGKIQKWDRSIAMPRLGEYSFRTELINGLTELREFEAFASELLAAGFVKNE